jgi:hypothetical protein
MATTDPSVPAPSAEVEKQLAAQETEYGTYVATGPIFIDGVRAYSEGHPVPVSNYKTLDAESKKSVSKVK